MPWLQLENTFPENRKVKRLAAYLEVEEDKAIALLVRLWCSVHRQIPSGELDDWNPADIADASRWEGNVEEFVDALVDAKLLIPSNRGYRIHDWDEHIGSYRNAQKQKKFRAKKKAEREVTEKRYQTLRTGVTKSNSHRRGEEKRGKEKRGDKKLLAPSDREKSIPIVISIPLIPRDGEFGVVQSDIDEWSRAYPAVDVAQQLHRVRAWCLSNPEKRKTARGIKRFINGWLAKNQDKIQPNTTRQHFEPPSFMKATQRFAEEPDDVGSLDFLKLHEGGK